jgi:hypothetical protein
MFIRTLHFSVWYLEDVLFHGWEPGYRLVGVAIHLGTGTLLMRLATRIGLPPAAAWIAALAFVINPASRSLVRDPTGLPELTLGLVYVAALWLWVEPSPRGARHAHPGWVRYALLVALVFTRDLAFTLPLVVAAVSFGQALDGPGAGSRGARDALGRALRVAWPACLVPLAQGLLVLGELTLDPTSGRPHPSNPMGEFGLFAEGVEVGQIAAAFLRDLPRNIVFPIWDKDPHAHLASWVVVAATVWLVAGSSATRKHLGAALGALVWVVAPMTMVFPFTTWEGPDNGHLLYLSTAGLALFIGAVWAGLPRSSARFVSTSLLAVALATSLAFHAGEIAGEKQRSALAAMANRWIDVVDSSAPDRRAVVLIGDDDAGQVRWKGALLARYARVEAWHQRYATVREAWLTDPTLAARGASPLVAGFDEDGEVTRWHGAEGPRVAGLHTAGLPPAGCEPVTIDGEETGLCSIERVARFASIREVLLTM